MKVWGVMLLCAALFGTACAKSQKKEPPPPLPPLEPKKEVKAPNDFHGPIDPEWPPTHPADLQVELEASRLLRQSLKKGERRFATPPVKMTEKDTPGLYVDQGQVGDFKYLEVIIGPLKTPDAPMPLVVVLHGRGGRARIPAPFKSDFPVRFFIPEAPDKLGPGFTWFATWTTSGQTQLLTRSVSARADQIAPAIEAFRKSRPTLGRPVLIGFSQGAILSFALSTRYPKRFAAAFPMSGWLPPALLPTPIKGLKYPYIYAQHGGADTVVPTAHGRETVRRLQALGLRVEYREHPGVGHKVTSEMEADTRRALRRILKPYAPQKK